MKFAVGLKDDFVNAGFDVSELRHSVDGTKVLSHVKYAFPIIPTDKLDVYESDSDEFKALLASPEWTKEEYADVDEVFEEVE